MLKAESDALFFLGKACTTKKNIINMEKHQHNLKTGNVKPGTSIETELARLALRDEKGKSVGTIPTAQERYKYFRRQAKVYFAQSIGVETVTEPQSRMVEGVPQEVTVVRAKDTEQQAEFVEGFREFDKNLYGQPRQSAVREQRRQRYKIASRPNGNSTMLIISPISCIIPFLIG